jgi:hypothetical protein
MGLNLTSLQLCVTLDSPDTLGDWNHLGGTEVSSWLPSELFYFVPPPCFLLW